MPNKIYAVPGAFCSACVWDELGKRLPPNIELVHVEIPIKSSISEWLQTWKFASRNLIGNVATLLHKTSPRRRREIGFIRAQKQHPRTAKDN